MTNNDWWRQFDQSDDPDAPTTRSDSGGAPIPAHWHQRPEPPASSADDAPLRPATPENLLPLSEPAHAANPVPRGRVAAIVVAIALVSAGTILALTPGNSEQVAAVRIDPTSVDPPAGYVAEPAFDRARAGLSDDFSQPLAFRRADSLLLVYNRSIPTDELDGLDDGALAPGAFADDLLAGLDGYAVSSDEAVDVGVGGRLVTVEAGTSRIDALVFGATSPAGAAVVTVAISAAPEVDIIGLARRLRLVAG